MEDQACELEFTQFVNRGKLPNSLARWLGERKALQQKLVHRFKPAGAQFAMANSCFNEVEDVPMFLLALTSARGRVLSYVGYNLYPIHGKRVLMLEYLCTDEGVSESQLNRHLVSLLMAWAAQDRTIRGVTSLSINPASGRMLSRYFGLAKVLPEAFLDVASTGHPLAPDVLDSVRWSYCCRRKGREPDWRHVWRSHRRIEVEWRDRAQELPTFNMHLDLEAPGVRAWVARLLTEPARS